MDDLLYDAYSIFFQILQSFAPDYVGDYGFLLVGYAFSSAFTLLVIWQIIRMFTAFCKVVLSWFSRRCD